MSSRNRGRPKVKLSHLSRTPLSHEEQRALSAALSPKLEPITAAILGCSYAEHQLELSLQKRINRKDNETWAKLTSDLGPLSTFSRKIEMAYALKIIDDKMKDDLHTIRAVRNAFAHARRKFDFTHELIANELTSAHCLDKKMFKGLLKPPATNHGHQSAYFIVCLSVAIKLIKKRTGRIKKMSPLARLMLGSPAAPKSPPAPLPIFLSGDPTHQAPQDNRGGLMGLGAELLRSTDNEK